MFTWIFFHTIFAACCTAAPSSHRRWIPACIFAV